MFSSKLCSHPGKPLQLHLQHVAQSCLLKFRAAPNRLMDYMPVGYWEQLIWLMGFSHDLGKSTSYFQKYLFEKDDSKRAVMKNQPETGHSLISAVMTFRIAKIFVQDKGSDFLDQMPFFLYLIIKKHHGNINNAIPMGDEADELNIPYEHLDRQLDAIDQSELQYLFDTINKQLSLDIQCAELPESLSLFFKKELLRKEKNIFRDRCKQFDDYFIFQYLYSLLLHSDKEDAIFGSRPEIPRISIPTNIVERYKEEKFKSSGSRMNQIREDIFCDANRNISKMDLNHKILSLNVPTGSGKTLTALSVALKLRERLNQNSNAPRIIYGLPYTSIIDQNFEVYSSLFDTPDSNLLLKHHHLGEISYHQNDSAAEFETSEARFLIESWESEIIISTFFQIFHTLFTNRNRMIQKFHKLANSIVLLDEVQALPYKYWGLVRESIKKMSKMFNIYFILITATQPRIFEPDEILELVPNKAAYFAQFNRVNLHFHPEKIGLNSFIEKCCDEIRRSDESYLFVMNTIDSSIRLFEELKKMELNADYFYLATNIVPRHRLDRINAIKQSQNRKIIVSTQMIEAGVDIDVQNVWRDFAPLESINQVCGRCNRNFSDKKGNVRIFEIVNENHRNTPFSKYIYGTSALSIIETKAALGNKSSISETEFLQNMDAYYQKLKEKIAGDESDKNLEYMTNLQFADLYKSFKLIDNKDYERQDVFIEIDNEAQRAWSRYNSLIKINDPFERKNEFLKFRKDFYDYVISVPSKYVNCGEEHPSGIVYAPFNSLDFCYDKDTGWKRSTGDGGCYVF
ncbi:CRISPR-associated helicase Cas3' [bacterium]|nr:CRISPR-associated helicase Cas3' [bacterium]